MNAAATNALLALCGMLALTAGCTHSALNRFAYDNVNPQSTLSCERLPDLERQRCIERRSVDYNEYEAQRAAATGISPPTEPRDESFEEFQKRRAAQGEK